MSVVIPVHDRAERLARALASVAAQRPLAPAEVIVVDDGSRDGSGEVARRLGARVIAHPRNLGQTQARNSGIEAAREAWVAFLDSDDEWLPDHLATLWSLREGAVFAATSSINCRPDPGRDRVVGPLTREPLLLGDAARLIHPHNFVTMSTAMARRDALLETGGFVAHDGVVEDLDMWVRLLERGPARVSPRVTVVYHVHGDQITDDLPRTRAAHLQVARRQAQRSGARGLVGRHEGADAWDVMRDSAAAGRRREAAAAALALVRSPLRVRGAIELIRWRVRQRRASARVGRDGTATVAILVSARRRSALDGELRARERADLRGLGAASKALRLIGRPAGAAVVAGAAGRVAARLLGMTALVADGRTADGGGAPR